MCEFGGFQIVIWKTRLWWMHILLDGCYTCIQRVFNMGKYSQCSKCYLSLFKAAIAKCHRVVS